MKLTNDNKEVLAYKGCDIMMIFKTFAAQQLQILPETKRLGISDVSCNNLVSIHICDKAKPDNSLVFYNRDGIIKSCLYIAGKETRDFKTELNKETFTIDDMVEYIRKTLNKFFSDKNLEKYPMFA